MPYEMSEISTSSSSLIEEEQSNKLQLNSTQSAVSGAVVVTVLLLNLHVRSSKRTMPFMKTYGVYVSLSWLAVSFMDFARNGGHAFMFSLVNFAASFSVALAVTSKIFPQVFTESEAGKKLLAIVQPGSLDDQLVSLRSVLANAEFKALDRQEQAALMTKILEKLSCASEKDRLHLLSETSKLPLSTALKTLMQDFVKKQRPAPLQAFLDAFAAAFQLTDAQERAEAVESAITDLPADFNKTDAFVIVDHVCLGKATAIKEMVELLEPLEVPYDVFHDKFDALSFDVDEELSVKLQACFASANFSTELADLIEAFSDIFTTATAPQKTYFNKVFAEKATAAYKGKSAYKCIKEWKNLIALIAQDESLAKISSFEETVRLAYLKQLVSKVPGIPDGEDAMHVATVFHELVTMYDLDSKLVQPASTAVYKLFRTKSDFKCIFNNSPVTVTSAQIQDVLDMFASTPVLNMHIGEKSAPSADAGLKDALMKVYGNAGGAAANVQECIKLGKSVSDVTPLKILIERLLSLFNYFYAEDVAQTVKLEVIAVMNTIAGYCKDKVDALIGQAGPGCAAAISQQVTEFAGLVSSFDEKLTYDLVDINSEDSDKVLFSEQVAILKAKLLLPAAEFAAIAKYDSPIKVPGSGSGKDAVMYVLNKVNDLAKNLKDIDFLGENNAKGSLSYCERVVENIRSFKQIVDALQPSEVQKLRKTKMAKAVAALDTASFACDIVKAICEKVQSYLSSGEEVSGENTPDSEEASNKSSSGSSTSSEEEVDLTAFKEKVTSAKVDTFKNIITGLTGIYTSIPEGHSFNNSGKQFEEGIVGKVDYLWSNACDLIIFNLLPTIKFKELLEEMQKKKPDYGQWLMAPNNAYGQMLQEYKQLKALFSTDKIPQWEAALKDPSSNLYVRFQKIFQFDAELTKTVKFPNDWSSSDERQKFFKVLAETNFLGIWSNDAANRLTSTIDKLIEYMEGGDVNLGEYFSANGIRELRIAFTGGLKSKFNVYRAVMVYINGNVSGVTQNIWDTLVDYDPANFKPDVSTDLGKLAISFCKALKKKPVKA